MMNVVGTAKKKRDAGLITDAEYQMIVDCDALVVLDEEGVLGGCAKAPASQGRI